MSTYQITYTVTGGANIPNALNNITIKSGSSAPLDPSEPSEATMQFDSQPYITYTEPDGSIGIEYLPANWWVGQTIVIYVKRDDEFNKTKIFEGLVDSATYSNQGPSEPSPFIEIHAVGYLSALSRFAIYGDFPAQNEIQRIQALRNLMGTLWYMYPDNMDWTTLGATTTWAQFDANHWKPSVLTAAMSNPFELEATTYDGQSLMDILQEMSVGLSGVIQDQTGYVSYRNFSTLTGKTYVNLSVSDIMLEPQFIGQASLANIFNSVTYQNSTTTVSDSDLDSWNTYSLRPVTVQTLMSDPVEMKNMASRKLVYLSDTSNNYLNTVTIDYDKMVTPLWTYMGVSRYTFTDMPWTGKFGPDSRYVIRGITWRITHEHAEADWVLASSDIWDALTAWKYIGTMAWSAYPATTKWNEVQ